ncbi:MAG: hypothetical protein KF819_22315, partial [Labilithrix sp.]|nr:hypothetical protein [Labilithrix sp.]
TGLLPALLALGVAQMVGCGSCVKDDSSPSSSGAAPELPARENKLKVVGIRKPYLDEKEGGEVQSVTTDAAAADAATH